MNYSQSLNTCSNAAPVVDPMAAKAVPIRAKPELKPGPPGTSVLNHPRHNETQPNPALPNFEVEIESLETRHTHQR